MDKLRIDKWLWAARFFKTRSLACDELGKGRVQVNGLVAKPAREVKPGDHIQLRMGPITREVIVLIISDKRGPASAAALLFQETGESVSQRQQAAEQRRLAPEPALTLSQGRPTKRDRRDGEKLRRQDWNDRWNASMSDSS